VLPGEAPETLDGRADAPLYQAKREGGDRLVAAVPTLAGAPGA
jgi:PleD family two-component response regulator